MESYGDIQVKSFSEINFESAIMDFQIIQGWEAKKGIVKFIKNNDLKLRKNIQERINFADSITETEYKRSAKNRNIFKQSIDP